METSFNLKLNNMFINMKNKFSSIFSRLFRKNRLKNAEKTDEMKDMACKKMEKNAKDTNKSYKFVENKKINENNSTREQGFAVVAIVKFLVITAVIVTLVIVIWNIVYDKVMKADITFNAETLAKDIKHFFVMLIYHIARWVLLVVDVIFSYVKSLCGLNMDFTSLNGIFSAESDIVFNMLITAKDNATAVIKNLIVLAIILIIIFTIIALIKSQLKAVSSGKPESVMVTIKKTMVAFDLLILTPFIASATVIPCAKWKYAPNLWPIEWAIPKNAFANAIPASVAACAIFSRASGSFAPSL